jgi:hypothetical protein
MNVTHALGLPPLRCYKAPKLAPGGLPDAWLSGTSG